MSPLGWCCTDFPLYTYAIFNSVNTVPSTCDTGYSGHQLDDNMLAAATEVGCKIEKKMAFSYDEDVSPRWVIT